VGGGRVGDRGVESSTMHKLLHRKLKKLLHSLWSWRAFSMIVLAYREYLGTTVVQYNKILFKISKDQQVVRDSQKLLICKIIAPYGTVHALYFSKGAYQASG
jgi:hypothetical protein